MYYWRGTVCVQGRPGVADTNGPGGPFIPEMDGQGGPLTRGTISSMTELLHKSIASSPGSLGRGKESLVTTACACANLTRKTW